MLYKTLDAPLSCHIEIETSCNQSCFHCYNFWRKEDGFLMPKMSFEIAERISEEMGKNQIFHGIINGGETLLNFEVLLFLIKNLKRKGMSFSLNSNLSLLDEEKAKLLRMAGLKTILTSLLSFDEKTHNFLANSKDSFQKVISGITLAKKFGFRVGINMVVSKFNVDHIRQTGLLAKELGASFFSATRVALPQGSDCLAFFKEKLFLAREDVKKISSELIFLKNENLEVDSLISFPLCFFEDFRTWEVLGKRSCSAGKTSMVISADGNVRACPHDNKSYGSILEEDLTSLWARMEEWRDGSLLPKTCLSCDCFSKCGGGCRFFNENKKGEDFIIKKENKEIIKPFLLNKGDKISVKDFTGMRIKPSCRFRKDREMGIINTEGTKNTFFSIRTFDVMKKVFDSSLVFTPVSLLETFPEIKMNKSRLSSFLSQLLTKGVLEKC